MQNSKLIYTKSILSKITWFIMDITGKVFIVILNYFFISQSGALMASGPNPCQPLVQIGPGGGLPPICPGSTNAAAGCAGKYMNTNLNKFARFCKG